MRTDKTVEEIVKEIDEMPSFVKAMFYGKAQRLDEILEKEKKILEGMYEGGRGYHILGIIGPYAVIEANNERDEHPFTSAYCKDEKWEFTHTFWDSMDAALFHAIGCKKEGCNSRFARYAFNMIKE